MERGRVQALRGEFASALSDCAEAIRLDPHLVPAMLIRGGVLIRAEKFDEALHEFDRAIQANPRYARAYNDRGVAYSKLGRLDEAIQDFSKAIILSANNAQAIANRGNAYQLQQRHEEALQDFGDAVVLDAKYAASYCIQRGQVEVDRGNFQQALADYAIALKIVPNSRTARAGRASAQHQCNADFAVDGSGDPVSVAQETRSASALRTVAARKSAFVRVPAAMTQPVIDLSSALTEDEVRETNPQAASEPELAMETNESPSAEPTEYAAEQNRIRDRDRQERSRLLAEKSEEIRHRNALEVAKTAKSKKSKVRRNPEEVAEQWRWYKKYAVIAIGVLVLAYYGGPLAWSLIPPSKNPYKEVAAEKFIEEYAKDPVAADDKFADKVIVVRGKVKIVRSKVVRGRLASPPKVYFEIGDHEKVVVECLFDDTDVVNEMRVDTEYRIAGRVQRYKPGTPITLKQAIIREGQSTATAEQTQKSRADAIGPGHDPRSRPTRAVANTKSSNIRGLFTQLPSGLRVPRLHSAYPAVAG
jgi:tetratricopeptide (TPR) repeat protein